MASRVSELVAELTAAVGAAVWPSALDRAIMLWRETRDPVVARLVDRVAARVPRSAPPTVREVHAWWMQHARPYDPVVATSLLDHFPLRLRARDVAWDVIAARGAGSAVVERVRHDPWNSAANWVDRMAAIEAWPDDPRLAPVLASWLIGPGHHVARPHRVAIADGIADRLIRLEDLRIVPRLEAYRAHVAAGAERPAVDRVVAALAVVRPLSAEVGHVIQELEQPTAIEKLWARAAHDREARGVLGDALVALGDSRGTFIALQAASDPVRDRRAHRLLAAEWDRWLGPDLSLLAVREGTELRGGMLEVLRVGHHFTPPWVWGAVAGHRELGSVHTVSPLVVQDRGYAQLVTTLAQLRTLEVDSIETLAELEAAGARLPITRLVGSRARGHASWNLRRFVELALAVAPGLSELVVPRALADPAVLASYASAIRISS